jgi:UDP-N-acetylmuramyl pentapeptide phosphotransferase/UDP-N-acetylglucosamine-1-phosphate transferase
MGPAMDEKGTPRAGGFILAASIIAGVVGGTVAGQPSAGFLVGVAAGAILALIIWWKDRR